MLIERPRAGGQACLRFNFKLNELFEFEFVLVATDDHVNALTHNFIWQRRRRLSICCRRPSYLLRTSTIAPSAAKGNSCERLIRPNIQRYESNYHFTKDADGEGFCVRPVSRPHRLGRKFQMNGKDSFAEDVTGLIRLCLHLSSTHR